jgi:hypothetical protein
VNVAALAAVVTIVASILAANSFFIVGFRAATICDALIAEGLN